MRWDAVKRQVAREVFTHISNCCSIEVGALILRDLAASNFEVKRKVPNHEIAETYADKAFRLIEDWDVRSATRLRDLFPKYFPSSLSKGRLIAYIEDTPAGHWVIEQEESKL